MTGGVVIAVCRSPTHSMAKIQARPAQSLRPDGRHTERADGRHAEGNLIRKAGVMGVVLIGGRIRAGDPIGVTLPTGPRQPLLPV